MISLPVVYEFTDLILNEMVVYELVEFCVKVEHLCPEQVTLLSLVCILLLYETAG